MYESDWTTQQNDDEFGQEHYLPGDLRTLYPNLSLALCGRRGSKKEKVSAIPPATLILFCRDNGIGFVVAPKDSGKNAHGFIERPENLLLQIEAALEGNRVGWKPATRKRS